jgi:tetratricopeptide (TPR) repeat protein
MTSRWWQLNVSDLIGGRYLLENTLGAGGMGVIYAGFDKTLERPVAIKLLTEGALGTEGRSRLLTEAKAAAALNHPNIVTVHDAGEFEGKPYIVMELVEGRSLHEERPKEVDEILQVATQLAAALEHAHSHNIIHRDLKPENVILASDGTAKLMDFGLARSMASRLTQEGSIVGSVFYLAPEQAMGKPVDGRADLYGLGVMLYELATERLPFQAVEALAVISQHLHASPVRPSNYREDLSAELEAIILKLLEKDPNERFSSAAELLAALERLKTMPLQAAAVDLEAAVAPPTLDDLARGRMVGRKEELSELLSLWPHAQNGRGQLALISGEPGVGKTRLARELIFRIRLQGASVLRGGCYEYEATTPYMPFVEALRDWVREETPEKLRAYLNSTAPVIAKLAPELDSKIGPLEGLPPLSASEERLRLFDSVARLFRRLSANRSLLLFLDDLHWADQGTLNLLHYLLRHLSEDPILILACYREVELDRSHPLADSLVTWNREHLAHRISLDRFSVEETRELLNTLFQEGGSAAFVEAIHRETEGNPFFIEEVVKALVESGAIYREGRRWGRVELEELAIPQSVKEAIGRRLNRLSESCIDVLHVAAALGKSFPFRELAALVKDEDQALDALDEARHAQLIRATAGESFAFTHDKIREVLYQELNPIRRRRLHHRIGEMIERLHAQELDSKIQDLAHHFTEGGELERGYEYSIRAAKDAMSLYAPDQAIDLAENAVDCALGLGDPEREREAYYLQSKAFSMRGRYPQASEAIGEAISRTEDPVARANLKVDLGTFYTLLSDPKGLGVLQEAIEVLETEADSAKLANAITLLGRYHHYQAEHRLAIEHYQKALSIAEPLQDHVAIFNASAYLAGGHQHILETDVSNEYARKCIKLGEEHDLPLSIAAGHEFLAENAFFLGEWDRGIFHAKEDQSVGEEHGFLDRVAWSLMAHCASLVGMGSLELALEMGLQAMGLAEDLEEYRLAVWIGGYLAIITAELGRLDEAMAHAKVAFERAESLAQVALRTNARSAMAAVYLNNGDYDEGLRLIEEALDIVRGTENTISYTWIYPVQNRLFARSGRIDGLEGNLPHMFELAEKGGSNYFLGQAHMYAAILETHDGDPEAARDHFGLAFKLLSETSSHPELARSLVARGSWLMREGDGDGAIANFKTALDLFQECGMRSEAEEAEALLQTATSA